MLIATRKNLFALNGDGDTPHSLLKSREIQHIAEGRSISLAALKSGEVAVLSQEGSHTISTGIGEPIECLLILNEDPNHFLVGVESPGIYAVKEGTTERLVSFDALECRDRWHTPWGGPASLRSLARTRDGWLYADIHVGSIMRSPDLGCTWEPVTPELHDDVHQVATSRRNDDRVYANTARAVYLSNDRGTSWDHRSEGFPYLYGRAIAVHPQDADCLLATVSRGPMGEVWGRLYQSENAGRSWTHVTKGFPESTPGNIDTFQLAFTPDGQAWSVVDATLYNSQDRGLTWQAAWEAPSKIEMIATEG